MVAFLYVGRTYKAQSLATVPQFVTCEECGCRYGYLMMRHSVATGHSAYMLNNQGAAQRAKDRAASALQQMFSVHDPVECPACGWFNKDMVEAARRQRWDWTPWGTGPNINPNLGYPAQRGHFPGMPTPILLSPGRTPPTCKPPTTLHPPVVDPHGFMTFQPQRDPLPNFCCACLAPVTDKQFQWTKGCPYPICDACKRGYIGRSVLCLLVGIIGGVLGTFLALYLPVRAFATDPNAALVTGCMGGMLLGFIAGLLLANLLLRHFADPVRIARTDKDRNLFRVRFAHPDFAARFVLRVAQEPLPNLQEPVRPAPVQPIAATAPPSPKSPKPATDDGGVSIRW